MSSLFFYKIIFMVELLIAEFLFAFRMPRKKNAFLRGILSCVICLLVAIFFPISFPQAYTSWYSSFMFLTLFLFAFLSLKWIFQINWATSFFCGIAAYTIQQFAFITFTLLFSLLSWMSPNDFYSSSVLDFSQLDTRAFVMILSYIDIFLLSYWGGYLILSNKLKSTENLHFRSTNLLFLTGILFIVDIILNAVVMYSEDAKIKNLVLYIYNILCCILIFYIEYHLIFTKAMNQEMLRIQEALHQSQKQYEMQKENIRLINIKCHDLKYQISLFEEKGMDRQSLQEIQEIISIYDSSVKTGNEVLDIILTEKSLVCHEKKVQLTCMVDCKDFHFMTDGDTYSLFGNLLDNALEAVLNMEQEEKRCIGLNVHTIENFFVISVENYYIGTIQLDEQGLPITTKKDQNVHGYGMKSVHAIVEKYHGTMEIHTDGDIFKISILFPLENGEYAKKD